MRYSWFVMAAALALMGCNKAGNPNAKDASAPGVADALSTSSSDTEAPAITVAPQIAYAYDFSFTLPEEHIAEVQARHIALCDKLGPRCHIVSMKQARDKNEMSGEMQVAVTANVARAFGDSLVAVVRDAGGETVGRTIEGEDLSKQIVDVEARLRGRQALADRLLQVVQTHQGSIADLVAAEKALADVQQEIDTARSELAEARGRVAMSTVQIGYAKGAGLGGFGASVSRLGSLVGSSLGVLLDVLAALLPWAVLGTLVVFVTRRWWRKTTSGADPVA